MEFNWLLQFMKEKGSLVGFSRKVFHKRPSFFPNEWFHKRTRSKFLQWMTYAIQSVQEKICACKEEFLIPSGACRDYVDEKDQQWIEEWETH